MSTVTTAKAGSTATTAAPRSFGPLTAAAMFASGATLGTALDGIHTNVSLLQYDFGSVQIGSLSTSLFVPPLLGVFYVVLGALHGALSADSDSGSKGGGGAEAEEGGLSSAAREFAFAAAAFGVLAANLEVSALLFESGAPSATTAAALAPLVLANWAFFEPGPFSSLSLGTPRVRLLLLAAFCGVAAPYCELPLLSPDAFGLAFPSLWHYTAPDWFPGGPQFAGMNGFVPLCYLMYVPAVGRLRRALSALEEGRK